MDGVNVAALGSLGGIGRNTEDDRVKRLDHVIEVLNVR